MIGSPSGAHRGATSGSTSVVRFITNDRTPSRLGVLVWLDTLAMIGQLRGAHFGATGQITWIEVWIELHTREAELRSLEQDGEPVPVGGSIGNRASAASSASSASALLLLGLEDPRGLVAFFVFLVLAGLLSLPVSPQRVFLLIAESVERWISLLKCCRRVYCVDTAREDHTSVPSTFPSESTLFFWLRKNDLRAKVTAKSLVQKGSSTAKAAKYSVSPQRVLLLLAESVERLISLLRCCRRVDTTREDHVSVPSTSSSEYDVFR
ncbi:hypothetical protein GW17_00019440 [Ensete ventricosum]|nr:hypothetical protein GW17_00019440 [Ensete ventricosum]